jgi:pyruvate/2-oxoglutarate dehydrogenase complex dihydrolipoamide dehydrogenase (E3) component
MAKFEFDSIVIGGGSAGLTASGIAANFGSRTMMIESHKLGGDCTWTGCVPSKILLKAGKVARQIRSASQFGLIDGEPKIDFGKVIKHVHEIREDIYDDADDPAIYEEMGIEVVSGKASFKDQHTLEIQLNEGGSRTVTSKYFFIATGAKASVPPIEGLDQIEYLTNESLFETERFPKELLIIGGGPIGTEMSQAFNDLGSKVTVIDMADRILSNDDEELAEILMAELMKEGVRFEMNASIKRVQKSDDQIEVILNQNDEEKVIKGTDLLIATGRKANVESLNLEATKVKFTSKGILVDDSCKTNIGHIYAIGDVTGEYQFTHMSEHMAKVAATNALIKVPMKIDRGNVPWVTYTNPELGHIGKTEEELKTAGTKYETYRFPYSKIDRALMENESLGMIKIFANKLTGKIYGASVLGAHAGEVISEYAVAMKNGVSLRGIADTIHPYPSWGLGARRAADQWYIKNQSTWSVKLIKGVFGYQGEIPDYSDPDRII